MGTAWAVVDDVAVFVLQAKAIHVVATALVPFTAVVIIWFYFVSQIAT